MTKLDKVLIEEAHKSNSAVIGLMQDTKKLTQAVSKFRSKFGAKYYTDCCKMMNEIQEIADTLTDNEKSEKDLMLNLMDYLKDNYLQERSFTKIDY